MISNHLVMPLMLRGRRGLSDPGRAVRLFGRRGDGNSNLGGDLGSQVVVIRRVSIFVVILLGYLYYRASGEAALVSIGLLSFAATAQIAPAFFGGLFWRRGTALGAVAGLAIGTLVWAYTLLMPSLALPGGWWSSVVAHGLFGAGIFRPEGLFGLEWPALPHGVFWSLGFNILAYIGFSLLRPANAMERLQANAFVESQPTTMAQSFSLWRTTITEGELQSTIARYLGAERTQRAFEGFNSGRGEASESGRQADIHLLRFGEHLLSSAIGAASSRLVLSLLLKRRNLSTEAAFKLLDDASAALQYNRDILQHGLDHAGQGITVLDRDLRLLAWNQAFIQLYDLPASLVRFGTGLDEIVRFNAARGAYGDGARDELMAARLESFINDREPVRLKLYPRRRSSRSAPTPCRMAASSRPIPTSPTRSPARRNSSAPTRAWNAESPSAPKNCSTSMPSCNAPRRRPRPPTPRRRVSLPQPATTSCSRSTPHGSTRPRWSSVIAAAASPNSRKISTPRSMPSRRS